MLILEKPYISDFLIDTINKNNYEVIRTKYIDNSLGNTFSKSINEDEVVKYLTAKKFPQLYTNSENSYEWILNNLHDTYLFNVIDLFNNKTKFRELTKHLYPNFYFDKVSINELDSLSLEKLSLPFIIKPEAGFFSLAVNTIKLPLEWETVKAKIKKECEEAKNLFPEEVLSLDKFIIEEFINGEEYAFDAYFNSDGEPVILNILHHTFSSGDDVSDRVYQSSKEIVEENLKLFEQFLGEIGNLVELKNFPLHVEVRKDKQNNVVPIEINPLRFGGFCTTADFTYYSYGFNSYEYFFEQKKPDWEKVLNGKEGKTFCLIVLDNSTGVNGDKINAFDYGALSSKFTNLIHLRKMDIKKYPLFGVAFVEVNNETKNEIEYILHSDLKEFTNVKE